MQFLTVTSEYDGMRLDRFINKALDMPKSAVWRMIRTGDIRIDNEKTSPESRISAGQTISVRSHEARLRTVEFIKTPPVEVIYEDELLLAVNKPYALKTQPYSAVMKDCLTERVKYYLKDNIISSEIPFVPGAVNRLDTNTSGIVLFAKTPQSAENIYELSREGKIVKKYITLVKGNFIKRHRATHWAVKDKDTNKMTLYDYKIPDSKEMTSIFEPIASKNGTTLISVRLITGRTHQIRSQLAHMGYPVAGDIKYGNETFNRYMLKTCQLKRQFLHLSYMNFKLWYSAGSITLMSEPYSDLNMCLEKLGYDLRDATPQLF